MFVYMYVTAATGRQPNYSKQINNNDDNNNNVSGDADSIVTSVACAEYSGINSAESPA
jgi:hypothetical protein